MSHLICLQHLTRRIVVAVEVPSKHLRFVRLHGGVEGRYQLAGLQVLAELIRCRRQDGGHEHSAILAVDLVLHHLHHHRFGQGCTRAAQAWAHECIQMRPEHVEVLDRIGLHQIKQVCVHTESAAACSCVQQYAPSEH